MDYKDMNFKIFNGCDRGLCKKGCDRQNKQLNTYDWLADVPGNAESTDLVEVQFKNTRKGYYHNVNALDLKKGDIVAVEASPGHDIGVVTLTGRLVKRQIKKANLKSADDIKRIYRIAKQVDMDKYKEAKSREHDTMIESRERAKRLGLNMKIGGAEQCTEIACAALRRMQSNALFACSLCSHAEQCATKQRIALWSTRLPPRKGTLPTVAGKKKTSKMLVFFLPCYHYSKIFKSKNAFLFRDLFRDLFLPLF